jgi:hypothetical protein
MSKAVNDLRGVSRPIALSCVMPGIKDCKNMCREIVPGIRHVVRAWETKLLVGDEAIFCVDDHDAWKFSFPSAAMK